MRDLLVLADAALRQRVRSRAAAALALAVFVALAFVVGGGGAARETGAESVVESTLLVAAVVAALVAAASGADLPLARASGEAEWTSALAPSAASRRAAPAVAGVVAATAAGAVAGTLATLALCALHLAVPTAVSTTLPPPADARASSRADVPALSLVLPASGANDVLELDVHPVLRDLDAADVGTTDVEIRDGGRTRTVVATTRGTVRVPLRPGAPEHAIEVRATDARFDLVLDAARVRGAPRPFAANALLAGLLLALAGASIAPASALLSRWTSASTAVVGGAVLALVGAAHGPLLGLAADAESVRGGDAAGAVLRAAAWIAPDLSGAARAFDAARGRALGLGALAGLLPAAAHALAATLLLAFFPARRARR